MAKRSRAADTEVTRRAFVKGIGIGAVSAVASFSPTLAVAAENAADAKLFDIIYSLRSIRRLKPDPIPEEILRRIVDAGTHAPSGGNRQDWGFILVRDPELKTFIRDRYRDAQQKSRASQPPISELPPALMNGSTRPFVGSRPRTTAMCIAVLVKIINVTPAASRLPKRSVERRATHQPIMISAA